VSYKAALAALSSLSAESLGTFRVADAVDDVSPKQLAALREAGVIERRFPGVYRLTAVPVSHEQDLRAALLWAGNEAAAARRSAGEIYGLEDVTAAMPEIVVPPRRRARSDRVMVHHGYSRAALMLREVRGIPVTGVEATLVLLAHSLDAEAFEIAFEDARRRRLTSTAAVDAYLTRWGRRGRPGVAAMRALLSDLDPVHASRSKLEVKTRRLLVAHGITDFVREFPLEWSGRTYLYDFAFEQPRVILEANARRWHDDPADYEHDNEKWSVPARHGYRLLFATWTKVTKTPADLVAELRAAIATHPEVG
jgi:very-short-patch-repair endonuclease